MGDVVAPVELALWLQLWTRMLLAKSSMAGARGTFWHDAHLVFAAVTTTVSRVGRSTLVTVFDDALVIAALLGSLILGLLVGRRIVGGGSWQC